MPDTGAPWNIPYVESTDLVSDWPADSLALANAIADGLDDAGNAGIGSNVVSTVLTTPTTISTSVLTDIAGLSASITPSSATSLVLVVLNLQLRPTADRVATYDVTATSGASPFGEGRFNSDRDKNQQASQTIVFLHSPASASAVTYQARAACNVSSVEISPGNYVSTLTLIEVAA